LPALDVLAVGAILSLLPVPRGAPPRGWWWRRGGEVERVRVFCWRRPKEGGKGECG